MATLTASSAMRRALEKAAPPAPRHAADKSSKKPETWIFPAGAIKPPALTQKATPAPAPVDDDPAILAYHRARTERCSALFLKLRQLAPSLFATNKPPPMAIGIYDAIVARLDLDAADRVALRVVLGQHVNRPRYQRALSREGAIRFDLDGMPASEVTPEQRERAAKKVREIQGEGGKGARWQMTKRRAPDAS